MDETVENPIASTDLSGKGVSGLLLDPLAETKDISLLRRAIKERWRIPEDRKDGLVTRLFDIVEKTSVTVMTKDGPESIDDKADTNAIAAARVIVAMEGQNQIEQNPTTTPTVNVGVAVNGVTPAQVAAELILNGEWRKIEQERFG